MITHAVLDVDGVFTDGRFHYDHNNKIFKVFGAHDSDAVKYLKFNSVTVEAISADRRGFEISNARMSDIGIPLKFVGEGKRLDYISKNYPTHSTFFMGDGLHDAKVLKEVKFGVCPANGCSFAKKEAKYVTSRSGGNGAILEAVTWLSDNKYLSKSIEEYLDVTE